ncbi:DUF1471 domain-containing protein [Mucilaginibacter sp. UR6-1]|uniref:DUF1471 domain-containing protein n=1 Tax=Mucilaginibacter sp. UR6-1 TaxID=1435643 RepID=UPI001E2E76A3|nr:DUF1471 domain-containing protein [Mucilaginibacter sp. UR6-1]MCC8407801.1 DUF1471 domain-containing protein [Mucilaginibacter sp. UR6-1]
MKKTTTIFLVTFLVMGLLAACSTPSYFGKTYSPTQNVDVYLDKADVKKPFTTMGTTKVGKGFSSLESAQQKVIELGKAKGADGVIMSLTEEVISTQQTGTGVVTQNKKKNVTGTSSSTTMDVKSKKITATFIKYE